ncbi:MAG: SDR family oxidoreductase [Gammaproteobacteria bacterium]|nr:SDR family oxidoreductase [Gammaproteobacteria bacterium]
MDGVLDFTGKVVLVTGGVSGIGAGISVRFLEAGATVVACSRRAPAELPRYADRTVDYRSCDVRKVAECRSLIERVVAKYGRLDALINNAGGSAEVPSADADPALTEKIIQLNLTAPFFMSQAAYQVMHQQPAGGSIINIASVSAVRASPWSAAYGAAKAGLVNLTESLAMEWGSKNIRVNALIVGLIATPNSLAHYGGSEGVARIGEMLPLRRMGEPKDVAGTCVFLCSSLAAYVSGAQIAVHGGGETPIYLDLARRS